MPTDEKENKYELFPVTNVVHNVLNAINRNKQKIKSVVTEEHEKCMNSCQTNP